MKCVECGGTFEVKSGSIQWPDKALGRFSVELTEYLECDSCSAQLFAAEASGLIHATRKRLLQEKIRAFPIEEFIPATEAAEILGISRQAIHKHRRIRRGFIYQTQFCGKTVYLKKSVQQYEAKGDGRFPLVKSEEAISSKQQADTTPRKRTYRGASSVANARAMRFGIMVMTNP